MRLKIIHDTLYEFNEQVFIQPHYLRFQPRVTSYNELESHSLDIFPAPIGKSLQSDQENNLIRFCWFDGMHHTLSVRSESVVILHQNNPFDFILFPSGYFNLPFNYGASLRDNLHASLIFDPIDQVLIDYGNLILSGSAYKTLNFVTRLTEKIHADFTAESRTFGEPYGANKTFYLKCGSCRDLSWMQIQLLRFMGVAARFTSGYYYTNLVTSAFELHAWVEVYLPGAGWVGFDPSNGIGVGSSHIPVCSSAQYENTMPVTGSFKGNALSALSTNLSISEVKQVHV